MRLHLLAAPDGTPRAVILASADEKQRDVALRLFARGLHGGELVIADKGYAGTEFQHAAHERFGATSVRPRRKNEPGRGPHIAPIGQCIESIFWTLKDRLGLQRHNARSLHGLRARIATKLLALAASVWLNHYIGDRPTRGDRRPQPLTRGINHLERGGVGVFRESSHCVSFLGTPPQTRQRQPSRAAVRSRLAVGLGAGTQVADVQHAARECVYGRAEGRAVSVITRSTWMPGSQRVRDGCA